MKVLLCWPYRQNQDIYDSNGNQLYMSSDLSWHGFPLGIGYLGSYLDSMGVDVKCYDFSFHTREEVMEVLRKESPDILGITCLTAQRAAVWDMFKYMKDVKPSCITVMGGHHSSIMWKQTLENFPYIDYCVYGDGALALNGLVNKYRVSEIPGLAHRTNDGVVLNNPVALSPDEYPFIKYELFNWNDPHLSSYYYKGVIDLRNLNYYILSASRGCYAHCKFCCVTDIWKKYTMRSPDGLADEIEYLISKYGNPRLWFKFVDETIGSNTDNIELLCSNIVKRDIDMRWESLIRGDVTDRRTMAMLRNSGLFHVSIGVESGSQLILDNISKGISVDSVVRTINNAHYNGINTFAMMIIGSPGESDITVEDTKKLLVDTKPGNIGVSYYTIFPGTGLYRDCVENDIIDDSYWLTDKYPPLYTAEQDFTTLKRWYEDIHDTWNTNVLNVKGMYIGSRRAKKSDKLSGYMIVSDDTVAIPSIESILDVCDEVVVVMNKPSEYIHDTISTMVKNDDRIIPVLLEDNFITSNEVLIRNTGIDKCSGDWILEIDSDEVLYEGQSKLIRDCMLDDNHDYHIFKCYQMCGDSAHLQFLRFRNRDVDPILESVYGWGECVVGGYTGSRHIMMYRNDPESHYIEYGKCRNGIHSRPAFKIGIDFTNIVVNANINYVHYSLCCPDIDIYKKFLFYRCCNMCDLDSDKILTPIESIPLEESEVKRMFGNDVVGDMVKIHKDFNIDYNNPLSGKDFTVMSFCHDHPIYMKDHSIIGKRAHTSIDDEGLEHIVSRSSSNIVNTSLSIGNHNLCNVPLDYHVYHGPIDINLKKQLHSYDAIIASNYYTFTAEACSINDNVYVIADDPDNFSHNYLDIVHSNCRYILTKPKYIEQLLGMGAPIDRMVDNVNIDNEDEVMRFIINTRR